MTDNTSTEIATEGEIALGSDTEDTTSTDSSAENNETDDGQSTDGQQGANSQDDPDKDKPFHEHPRWKEREEAWEKRFNDQESRHQEDLRTLRDEFGGARKSNAENTDQPAWFGGTQEQWDAYRADRDKELTQAEERAVKRLEDKKSSEDKSVKEATDYMQTEMTAIQSDKTLNPNGEKVDPNKLLKVVLDNDLTDSKGRWNYRAGWRILQQQGKATPRVDTDRKKIAGATTSENRGETKPPAYKTSSDFKKNRPW